jgi:tape measure domain-containing protein
VNIAAVLVQFKATYNEVAEAARAIQSHFSNITSAASNLGSRLSSSFSSIVGGISSSIFSFGQFAFFAQAGISAISGFAQGLFGGTAAMEQSQVAFTGLLGSSQAATAMLKQLWNFAATTPFEFPDLVQDTQMLMGMGVAAKDVIPWMKAIGDAAAGVGRGSEDVQRITLALGQMSARTKITGGDMMQLTEAGIPAWKILASSMHLSVAQVQALSEQGKLGSDAINMLVAGMERMYPNQMMNQSRTFNGLLSTLHDNAEAALRAFAGPLFAQAKGSLTQLTNIMGSPGFANFAKTLGTDVGNAVSSVVKFIKDAVNWFGQFKPQVDQMGAAFGNLGRALAPVAREFQQSGTSAAILRGALEGLRVIIVLTLTGITNLANGLASVITWIRQGGPTVQFISSVFNTLAAVVRDSLLPVWKQMVDSWRQLQPVIQPLLPVLGAVAIILGVVIVGAILGVLALLAGLIAGFSKVLIGVMQFITGMIEFWTGLYQAISGIVNLIVDLVTGHFDKLGGDLRQIWNGIKLMFQGVWDMIKGIFNAAVMSVVDIISTFIGTITKFFRGLANTLVGGSIIPDMVNSIVNVFKSLPGRAMGAINSLAGQMSGFFSDLAGKAVSWGSNIIQGVVNGINNMAGSVADAAGNIASTIASFLPRSPAKAGPLRDLNKFGPALVGQFATGIVQNVPQVRTAVGAMVQPFSTIRQSGAGAPVSARPGGITTIILNVSGYDLAKAIGPELTNQLRINIGSR